MFAVVLTRLIVLSGIVPIVSARLILALVLFVPILAVFCGECWQSFWRYIDSMTHNDVSPPLAESREMWLAYPWCFLTISTTSL